MITLDCFWGQIDLIHWMYDCLINNLDDISDDEELLEELLEELCEHESLVNIFLEAIQNAATKTKHSKDIKFLEFT